MRIERTEDADVLATTRAWLGEYNAQFVAWDRVSVQLVAYDNDGELAGSLGATMYWEKLRVDSVVVRPDRRGRGIGAALMRRAEDAARDAGCSGVYLDTMSFQALDFYRKLGYELIGSIGGFASDAARHYLHKSVAPRDTDSTPPS